MLNIIIELLDRLQLFVFILKNFKVNTRTKKIFFEILKYLYHVRRHCERSWDATKKQRK